MQIGYLMQQGVEVRRPPFDGPANHVREIIRELERLGHRVRVLLALDDGLWKSDDLLSFTPVPVPLLERGPLRLSERGIRRLQYELQLPYAALFESLRFALACRQELADCDLFYERMGWPGYGGAIAARWLGIPLVLENNGDHLADLEAKGIAPQGMQRRLSVALVRRAVSQAAHVVVTGEGWRGQFMERWGVDARRVTTVENGTALVQLLKRESLRSFQWQEGRDAPITLAYVGGFYPWHGVGNLLRASARAIKRGLPLRLLLVGSGFGFEEARALAGELGLSERVTFTGQLAAADFAPLLARADIGVAPYCGWKEFSGLKLFDYKAAGLAIIASGKDGQPATLRHGQTGWIVPPCDEMALYEAIMRLAQDGALRKQMGRAARVEAESLHGWHHTAQQLEQLFLRLIEQQQSRRAPAARRRSRAPTR